MDLYLEDIHPYLVQNTDHAVNHGFGYFIKDGTPKERIDAIRAYHDERLNRGEPYFILDFLVEDYERDPDSVVYKFLSFYRKRETQHKGEKSVKT